MSKYWTKGRLKTSLANSKLWIFLADIKALFKSPISFNFVDYSIHSFFGLVLISVSSFPFRHPMVIFSTMCLGLQSNAGFTFKASHNSLTESPCMKIPDTHLTSVVFLSEGGIFHQPFLIFLTLNPELYGRSCQIFLLIGAGIKPPYSITSSPNLCFQWFPSLLMFNCPGTCPEDQASLELRDLLAPVPWVLAIKVYNYSWT